MTRSEEDSDSDAEHNIDDDDDDNEGNKVLKIIQRSTTVKQLLHKVTTISKVIVQDSWITTGNIVVLLLADICVGVLLSSYLISFLPNLYESVHGKIEELLGILLQILEWLSGAPAGLKLNASLNSLLGRFFSYNLHLWRNYIQTLEPILKFLLLAIVDAGVFGGFTVQIALLKDLISVATFHIYCLYIYATRLFNIELNALQSLGHLFFGRKWNPLRNRIDSVQLSHSEMFLSSLSFTIAVFLSPTIIIYYVVFLSLRLPILIVESFLKFIIHAVNGTELVTLFLVLIVKSSAVPHEIYLKPELTGRTRRSSSNSTGKEEVLPIVKYRIQTRPIYKIKLPNFGKSFKHILTQIIKSQVITN